MAERYAVQTGNWSDTATWDGGTTLPGSGDTVHANTYTVAIDQDVTVLSITNAAGTTAASGGSFTITAATININADMGGGDGLLCNISGSSVVTVTGNITAPLSGGANSTLQLQGGTTTINGDVGGGDAGANCYPVRLLGGSVVVNGNVTGPNSGTNAYAIYKQTGGDVTINGNLTGGSGNGRHALHVNQNSGTVTVIGTVTGGPGSGAYGIHQNSAGTIYVTGDVYGDAAQGVVVNQAGYIDITGDIYGGASSSAIENSNVNGSITVRGNAYASSAGYAYAGGIFLINSSDAQTLTLYGNTSNSADPERIFYTLNAYPGGA